MIIELTGYMLPLTTNKLQPFYCSSQFTSNCSSFQVSLSTPVVVAWLQPVTGTHCNASVLCGSWPVLSDLLLTFTSTAIAGFWPCSTHNHIILSLRCLTVPLFMICVVILLFFFFTLVDYSTVVSVLRLYSIGRTINAELESVDRKQF
jgi:hypothetical protein